MWRWLFQNKYLQVRFIPFYNCCSCCNVQPVVCSDYKPLHVLLMDTCWLLGSWTCKWFSIKLFDWQLPVIITFNIAYYNAVHIEFTSNVTGRHWGPKQKLRAGYRVPSLKRTSYPKRLHYNDVICCDALWSSISRWYPTVSALCMYLKITHHLHPLGYLFISFAASIAVLARGEESHTQSLNHWLA